MPYPAAGCRPSSVTPGLSEGSLIPSTWDHTSLRTPFPGMRWLCLLQQSSVDFSLCLTAPRSRPLSLSMKLEGILVSSHVGSEPKAWAPGSSLTLKEKEPSLKVCLPPLVGTGVRAKMSMADLGTLRARTALHRADSQMDKWPVFSMKAVSVTTDVSMTPPGKGNPSPTRECL